MVRPPVVIVVAIVVIPVLWNVVLSFQDLTLLDIRNAGLFQNASRWTTSSACFTGAGSGSAISTPSSTRCARHVGSIALGLVAALALRRTVPRAAAWSAPLMLLPYVAPVVAVTFVWQIMLNPQFGIVNLWVSSSWAGRAVNFLGRRRTRCAPSSRSRSGATFRSPSCSSPRGSWPCPGDGGGRHRRRRHAAPTLPLRPAPAAVPA